MFRHIVLFLACTFAAANAQVRIAVPAGPPANRHLIWILSADGKLSAYDGTDYRLVIGNIALPADAPKHPENISVSRSGIVIYADVIPNTHLRHLWSSNNYAHEVVGGAQDLRPAKGGGYVETAATPDVRFSADGARFFWFENRNTVVMRTPGGDVSSSGAFIAWTTDLQGGDPQAVARFDFPDCKCGTGACSETCPDITAWTPRAGVADFFFTTESVSGQVSFETLETDLYRFANGAWTMQKLSAPVEGFLDATDHGNVYIGVTPDAGCCGWMNEGSDLTYLVRNGTATNFFDEFARFHNPDYDVSFFTANALLAPDVSAIAYTINATYQSGEELRLSDSGKDNPDELRRIKTALASVPLLEVVSAADVSKVRVSLPHTELLAWRDAQHVFALQNGQIVVVDVSNGKATPTPLKAEKAAYVFVQ